MELAPASRADDPRPTVQIMTDEQTAPILRMEGIVKSFGGVRALRGVDLELCPGEVLALVGENGAG